MGVPLAALAINQQQPGPLDQASKALQLKALAQQQQYQAQAQPLELQQRQQAIEEQQNKIESQKALRDAYAKAVQPDEKGQPHINADVLQQALAAGGHGDEIPGVLDSLNKFDKSKNDLIEQGQKIQASMADANGHAAAAIKAANYDPHLSHTILDTMGNSPQVQQLRQLIDTNPASFKQHVDAAYSASPAIQKMQQEQAKEAETARHNKAMEEKTATTEAGLAERAAAGDQEAIKAIGILDKSKRESRPVTNIMTANDAKDIADAIESGDQPPTLQGLYRNAGPVRAELARRGVPLAAMETDWKATQKYISSLNSTQQVKLQQSISSASELLPKIDGIYNEWKKLAPVSGFKIANHAALVAMKNMPGRAGAVASALDTQIAELTADLGNIYMGGNSPTDQALKLGHQALQSDWGPEAFEEGLKQAKLNIGIRQNSMKHGSGPAGLSGTTNYAPGAGAEAPTAALAGGKIRARDPQGKLHEAPAGTALPPGWKAE